MRPTTALGRQVRDDGLDLGREGLSRKRRTPDPLGRAHLELLDKAGTSHPEHVSHRPHREPSLGVRRFTVTDAAAYDGARHLASVLDKTNTASLVWAGTEYCSKATEAHVTRNGVVSKVRFRRRPGFD